MPRPKGFSKHKRSTVARKRKLDGPSTSDEQQPGPSRRLTETEVVSQSNVPSSTDGPVLAQSPPVEPDRIVDKSPKDHVIRTATSQSDSQRGRVEHHDDGTIDGPTNADEAAHPPNVADHQIHALPAIKDRFPCPQTTEVHQIASPGTGGKYPPGNGSSSVGDGTSVVVLQVENLPRGQVFFEQPMMNLEFGGGHRPTFDIAEQHGEDVEMVVVHPEDFVEIPAVDLDQNLLHPREQVLVEFEEQINDVVIFRAAEDAEREVLRRQENEDEIRNAMGEMEIRHFADVVAQRRNRHYRCARTLLPAEVDLFDVGIMDLECPHCLALHFREERNQRRQPTHCCEFGKVNIAEYLEIHPRLFELYTANTPDAIEYRRQVMQYNDALSFVTVGTKEVVDYFPGRQVQRGHVQFYKIQGQFLHLIDNIDYNRCTSGGSLYFLAPLDARQARVENHQELDDTLLEELDEILRETNPFAVAYENARRVAEANNYVDLELRLLQNRNRHLRPPTINEVACIFVANEEGAPDRYDIRIYLKRGGGGGQIETKTLSYLNHNVDPMTYPLLFPAGDPGLKIGELTHVGRPNKNVTLREYYQYRKSSRPVRLNPATECGRLSQKFLVDAYVKIESNNLKYIMDNQQQYRAANYDQLQDYMDNEAEQRGLAPGRLVILPSNYIGSPRNCMQNYQDAIAMVTSKGKPDFFVTFTCNPSWPDVARSLRYCQVPADRPDILNRVFRLKLNEFMDDLLKKHVLGVVVNYLYVIEFQKRGLPHAHILLTMAEEDKPKDVNDIDNIICAEIPDRDEDPELYDMVTKQMMHGPCGPMCLNEDGKCERGFPMRYRADTVFSANGYPRYRRREDGRYVLKRYQRLDNRYVVSYNKWMTKKYNAHINVEVCTSMASVKYLYKYVYKGNDKVNVQRAFRVEGADQEELVYDEVRSYVENRYVSANEADWRISGYLLHNKSHHVERLDVHLPDNQQVYFREGQEEIAMQNARIKNTRLTAWFQLNTIDPDARQYLYSEIPYHYVFKDSTKTWSRRQTGASRVVSRMYSVSPRDRERFYLRTLLLHVRGATSYEDLRRLDDGTICETFAEAAHSKGLLHDDTEWRRCMQEAATHQMPRALRILFATLLLHCNVDRPNDLWIEHLDHMSEDYVRRGDDRRTASRKARSHVDAMLRKAGKTMEDYDIANVEDEENGEPFIVEDLQDDEEVENMEPLLNRQQREVFDAAIDGIERSRRGENVTPIFVDGPGGTGKTFLYNTIISAVRRRNGTTISCAWTGIAAILLKGGRTVHSMFQLPVPLIASSTSRHSPESATHISNASVIVIDEISMATKFALNAIDQLLRYICKDERPFGNKMVIVGGDFRQTLPVTRGGNSSTSFQESVKSSPLWHYFRSIKLTENMRAHPEEVIFKEWLIKLGDGILNEETTEGLPEAIRRDFVSLPDACIVSDVIDAIYGATVYADEDGILTRTILCPRNEDCDTINATVLERLRSRNREDGVDTIPEVKIYLSSDKVKDEEAREGRLIPIELLNSVNYGTYPPHRLELSIGCIVMLLHNVSVGEGLLNGTRLQITRTGEDIIEATILSGPRVGEHVFVPRLDLDSAEGYAPVPMVRRQFPVKLAFAMTINKAQGQTFEKVGIALKRPVFTHGQLYVAFSRAKSFSDVKVEVTRTKDQGNLIAGRNTIYTKNIVYLPAVIE